jgi:hypothetical protein
MVANGFRSILKGEDNFLKNVISKKSKVLWCLNTQSEKNFEKDGYRMTKALLLSITEIKSRGLLSVIKTSRALITQT